MDSKFAVRVMRKFPGVPKAVEEFREKIVEASGVTGVRRLARLLKIMDTSGEGLLSRKEFKFGLSVSCQACASRVRGGGCGRKGG